MLDPTLLQYASPDERRRIEATLRRKQALLSPADFALATDPLFQDYTHVRAMSDAIVALQPNENLLISAPPRHGKTHLCAEKTPEWLLACNPDNRVGYVTYGQDLSIKTGRKVRDSLTTHRPITPSVDNSSRAVDDFAIKGHRGLYFASSVGGALTGMGFDWMIYDDLLKDKEAALSADRLRSVWEWIVSTAWTRREPGGRSIFIMTRWAGLDPIGHILAGDLKGDFKFLNLPALALDGPDPVTPAEEARERITILDGNLGREPGEALCPERYNEAALDDLRNDDYWFEAGFQGNPIPKKGALFDTAKFQAAPRPLPTQGRWFGVIDTANSLAKRADYTVLSIFCAVPTASGGRLHVVYVFRHKRESADHMAWVRECLAALPEEVRIPWIGVEDKTFGSTLLQNWRRNRVDGDPTFRPLKADTDKYTRATNAAAVCENDQMFVPDKDAPWLPAMLQEAVAFPDPSMHDDIVDTLAYGAIAFYQMPGIKRPKNPPAPRLDQTERAEQHYRRKMGAEKRKVRRINALRQH